MKRIFSIFGFFIILSLSAVEMAGAITVTASPNPAYVGQNVSIGVNATITRVPCAITVSYGDGATSLLTCNALGGCTQTYSHSYAISGTYPVSAGVAAAAACTAAPAGLVSLNVTCRPFSMTTTTLPDANVGQPYNVQLRTSGGTAPITWSLDPDGGPLPEGLTLTSTGLLSGTPRNLGAANIQLLATDSCDPPQVVGRVFVLKIATPATSTLHITRMQLSFENGRPEITVPRNQQGLKARVEIRFDGSGLLQGYWEVDGRTLAYVNQNLVFGSSLSLTTPALPLLPTFEEGAHRVKFIITNPQQEIDFPVAIYYVTAEESPASLVPLRLLGPQDNALVTKENAEFSWNEIPDVEMYLINYFGENAEKPVFSAYTRDLRYRIPEQIRKEIFTEGKTYTWQVSGFNADGKTLAISKIFHFSCPME